MVHGWDGNPNNHWFPWLKKELEKRGFEVHVPANLMKILILLGIVSDARRL